MTNPNKSADEGKGMEEVAASLHNRICSCTDLTCDACTDEYKDILNVLSEERRKVIKEVLEWPEIRSLRTILEAHSCAERPDCRECVRMKAFDQRKKKELEG